MENKILRLTTSSLFALQGAFAIFWSLYMYLEVNLRLTEMFVIGCILLLFALLFNFRKPIIKKTAYAVLVLYDNDKVIDLLPEKPEEFMNALVRRLEHKEEDEDTF